LYDSWTREAVAEILFCIEVLLTDMEKLQTTYGLTPHGRIYGVVGEEGSKKRPGFPDARPHPRPSENIGQGQKRVNILRKFHWSILDKEKFSDLITELRELVQRLNDLVPPTSDVADFRTVSQRIPAIPGFDGDGERGYRPQRQNCEGDTRAFDVTRKQGDSRSIMPPPSPLPSRALVIQPKVDEIAHTQNTRIQREGDGSYRIYRYYRIT
jgi:hypothetical protein